jgi:hypothetical protein
MRRLFLAVAALLAALLAPDMSVGAEDLASYDHRVVGALDLLDSTPATNRLRGVLDANRVRIQFVPMAPGIYARYSVVRHVVEIDQRWIDVDTTTLAAVLAHEATHAEDAVNGYLASGGAAACIDSEIRAFRTSAQFWIELFGGPGKPDAEGDLDRQLNLIAERQLRDPQGLEELVRQTYSSQCAH